MISSRYRFIFIHAPKTAGNSLQELLLPFSDDMKTVVAHQDGVERFGIAGAVTRRKHATLADYEEALGADELTRFLTVCVSRNPWDRAVSHYFSPHRWMERHGATHVPVAPVWDEARFLALLAELKPVSAYAKDRAGAFRADCVLRFEHLAEDLTAMWRRIGLPGEPCLPHRNRKAAGFDIARAPHLVAAVADAMAEDIARFGYTPPAVEAP